MKKEWTKIYPLLDDIWVCRAGIASAPFSSSQSCAVVLQEENKTSNIPTPCGDAMLQISVALLAKISSNRDSEKKARYHTFGPSCFRTAKVSKVMTRMMLLRGTLSSTQSSLLFAVSKNGMVSNIPVWNIVVVRVESSSVYVFAHAKLLDALLCPYPQRVYRQERYLPLSAQDFSPFRRLPASPQTCFPSGMRGMGYN